MAGRILVGVMLMLLVAVSWAVAEEKPWFDMEQCEMCKNFGESSELMKGMTWEQHKISNGFMSVSIVGPELLNAYREANSKCNTLGEKLMGGYQASLCGSCDAFGMLLAKGAKMEDVEMNNGGIMLLTSSDPAIVADLHSWVDRSAEEMKKMMATESHEKQ